MDRGYQGLAGEVRATNRSEKNGGFQATGDRNRNKMIAADKIIEDIQFGKELELCSYLDERVSNGYNV